MKFTLSVATLTAAILFVGCSTATHQGTRSVASADDIQNSAVSKNTTNCSAVIRSDKIEDIANVPTVDVKSPIVSVKCEDGASFDALISSTDAALVCKAFGYRNVQGSVRSVAQIGVDTAVYSLQEGSSSGNPALTKIDRHQAGDLRGLYIVTCTKQ